MSTHDCILVGALLLAALIPVGAANGATGENAKNSCVQCHSQLPSSNFFGAKSHSWTGSVHQQHDVTCDQCHGGNPAASEEKEAHEGVLGSRDPQSRIYFKNIPATCGRCHGAEFYKFSQSLHYKMLESTGQGPDCVTCHGSMVTTVLSPDNLLSVCDRCHNKRMGILPYIPKKAKAVLLLLRESQALLDAYEKLCQTAGGNGQTDHLQAARSFLHSARLGWHRFDLDAITEYLQEMYDSLKACRKPDSGKTKASRPE
jgi:hypothetical protein